MAKLSTIVSFTLIMILLIGSHYCSASRPAPIKGMGKKEEQAPVSGLENSERKTKRDNSRWPRILQAGREEDVPRNSPPSPISPGNPRV
ncbi:hypothetical protein HHK36_013896 [Tetracentron sinense]|uniref:Uncharacterized protein n=1 Tax=Tetracentron sinense TaxID=13715 RepID=A0A834ZE51_TETSI|nr:hypothetical protein HHK36_013896 [Tetracentron sinense]